MAHLYIVLSLCFLFTYLTQVFVVFIECVFFKESNKALFNFWFKLYWEATEGSVSDWFVATIFICTCYYRSLYPREKSVYHRRICLKIFVLYLRDCPLSIFSWHISIKFSFTQRCFLILQTTQDMHEKLMAIVLHHRKELLLNHILKPSWINILSFTSFISKCCGKEVLHLIKVVLLVVHTVRVCKGSILLEKYVISEVVDRKQTL